MPQNKISFSNILILISIFFTGLSYIFPSIMIFGMNDYFLNQGFYHIYIVQFFSSQFLHGGITHLLFNSLFIYYFGNIVENIIGHKKMILFFIASSIFIGGGLTVLGSGNTVGISGFALALLTFYTLTLWKKGDPEYTGGITAIIINIVIGLSPGISFLGHALGMVFGFIFWFLYIKILRSKKT